jgi:6,7-dimethyl-8-ribityllumazine synthase
MLKKTSKTSSSARGAEFIIIASRYNARFVNSMLRAAKAELSKSGAASIKIIRVPGAFEIPVVAARAARALEGRSVAIICLGIILRGATTHAQHIAEAVTQSLAQIQIAREIPVIHEVLLLESIQQARERCLDPKHNRGREAAQTAIAMIQLLRKGI